MSSPGAGRPPPLGYNDRPVTPLSKRSTHPRRQHGKRQFGLARRAGQLFIVLAIGDILVIYSMIKQVFFKLSNDFSYVVLELVMFNPVIPLSVQQTAFDRWQNVSRSAAGNQCTGTNSTGGKRIFSASASQSGRHRDKFKGMVATF